MSPRIKSVPLAAIVGALALTATIVVGQQRTPMFRADLTGVAQREGVVLNVELAAGLTSKKHFHPGDEFIHVVEGSVAVGIDGKPEVIVSAGQTIHIPANAVHYGRNLSATSPAKAISFGVFEKGKPDMTVVP